MSYYKLVICQVTVTQLGNWFGSSSTKFTIRSKGEWRAEDTGQLVWFIYKLE